MLAIFDIDGTICDSQKAEGEWFAKAIEEVTGVQLSTLDWSKYTEPTSSAIVGDLLYEDPKKQEKEDSIRQLFLKYLKEAKNAMNPQTAVRSKT